MQWDSHHSLSAKYSVIGSLNHRAKTVCTGPELLHRELQHLRKALVRCKYPHWAINRVQSKLLTATRRILVTIIYQHTSNNPSSSMDQRTQTRNNNNHSHANSNPNACTGTTTISRPKSTIGYIVIPYTQGLGGSFKNTCGNYGIQTYFKGNTTIKQVLMKPKDQDPKDKKWGNLQLSVQSHSLQ